MSRRRVAVVAAVLAAAPGTVRADERATAQQLFQQGKELFRVGDFAHACPKFEAAAQLSSTPGVRLNLADCWVAIGRTASAWTKYDEAFAMAERDDDATAADSARKGRAQLEPQLSYVTVVVGPDAAVSGLVLRRDGHALPNAAWGVAIPVDPGKHELSGEAPGRRSWSTTETVAGPGTKATTIVPVLAPDQVPLAIRSDGNAMVAEAPPADRAAPVGATQKLAGWVTGGLGVVALGVGAGGGIDAFAERGSYRSHTNLAGQCADLTCQTDSHAAVTAGDVSTAGFIAGGALVATGVVLLLTAPSRHRSPAARLTPIVAPQTAGMAVFGDW